MENNTSNNKQRPASFSKIEILQKLWLSLTVNVFTVFSILFFAPLEVFFGNINEFTFSFGDIWWILALSCTAVVTVLTAILCLLPKKVTVIIDLFIFGGGLCCYVQSMLLNGKMGTLTGVSDVYGNTTVTVNAIIWLLIFAAVIVLYFIFAKRGRSSTVTSVIKFVALALTVMQCTALVSLCLTTETSSNKRLYLSNQGEFELSKNGNVIVFIVDTCDSSYFEEALYKYPDMTENLNGFTYYPNTVSIHSRTYPSIPYMLTGNMCYFDKPYREYVNDAFQSSTFFERITSNGYDIGLYTNSQYLGDGGTQYVANAKEQTESGISFKGLIKQMTKISLYRNAPYLIKQEFAYDGNTVNEEVVTLKDRCIQQNDVKFYNELKTTRLTADQETGAFRFYHLFGTHPGANIDENVKPTESFELTRAVRGNIRMIEEYIAQMKTLGIFESSTIIITADHGSSEGTSASMPLVIDTPARALLLVKPAGINDENEFSVNNAPLSHADLFATIIHDMGGDYQEFGKSIYEYSEDTERTRYYYNTALFSDKDGEIALREYEITGNAADIANWRLTGKYWDINYSERAVSPDRLSNIK